MNDNISKNAAAKLLFLSLFFLSSCKAGAGGGTTTDANEKAGPPPDLVISALSTATTAFAPGQSFSVSSTVINKGNGPSDYFIIRFHLSINATYGDKDDIPFLEFREVKSLAAGESNTDSTVLTVPISTPPGSYVLCAKADDKNRISESDNNNNTRCLSTLTLQIEEIRGPSSPPPNGYGYFVKKFTDNSADLGNPRQDGIPDFIVSQAEGKGGGAVYVYSGETGKLIYLIKGTGLSYPADVGDLDGDGVSDLFVGDATSGVAQVYSGLDGAPLTGLTFKGDGDNDGFGESVAAIGDINGDGIPDLIVGAPGGNYAVLYSGVDGSRITRIDSPDGTGSFGCSVTGVINGDGIPDFIIGAPNASPNGKNGAGSAFVYSGQADAKGNFPMLHRLDGEHSGDGFGGCFGAIDTVGDLNGDGKMELAVAASRASPNQLYAAGSIYLFDGATGLPFQRPDRLGPMRLDGEAAYALLDGSLFGSGWISNLGDLNGDGYPDFMAGTSGAAVNGQAYAGRVLIFSGYDGSVLSRIDNPMLNFIPHFFGVSGANLGDLYGDGNLEILIGAGELSDGEPGMGFLFSLNVIPKFQVTYPDLVMVNVTPNDSSVNAGATLLVTNTVKNQWLAPSVGFKIGFNLSPTASYTDPRAVAIPTTRTITSLAAGASSNDITGLVIPSTTPAGSYYICAMVDYANTVKETNESNNTRCSAATVTVPPPDLVMTALSTATTTVGQGERFSLSNTVQNQGGASAKAFSVAFHLSKNAVYGDGDDVAFTATQSVTSLAVGASSTASTTLTVPTGTPMGNYYICANADNNNAVTELDETNNTLCSATTVNVLESDLIVTAVTPNASTASGGTLSVTDTVKNQGLASAGSFKVGYNLSPTASYSDPDAIAITTTRGVSSLAAGATSTATTTLTIPNTTPTGNYYVCAKADLANAVTESDETNNTLCGATTVNVSQSDLIMSAVSTTATVLAPGSSLTLSNSVKNQGAFPAGPFTVAFHLSVNTTYGDGDDVAFSATHTISFLSAGGTDPASTSLTIPFSTPLGTYYVCAMADSGNTVSESDETNNSLCTGTTIQVSRPDLIETAVTPNASTVNQGATLSVTDTVQNQGPLSTVSGFRGGFHLSANTTYGDGDDVAISTTRVVSALAAGAFSTGTTSLTIPSTTPPGTYYVCAMADSLLLVTESDETNNTLCSSTTITVTP